MMENKTKIDLKNKSIFITGVAGFIGSNLAKRLLSTVEGVKVVGLDNMNNYYLNSEECSCRDAFATENHPSESLKHFQDACRGRNGIRKPGRES